MISQTLRKTIKLTAAALVVAVSASSLVAEKGEHRGGKRKGGKGFDIERMKKELNLTAEQEKKIIAIKKQYHEQFKSQREAMKPNKEKLRALMHADKIDLKQIENQMRVISEDQIKVRVSMVKMRSEIDSVLTKEQKQKMKDKRKEKMEKRKEKRDK